jgi:heme/copper-type cytochrome/quinol oxidase subunit 2
VGIFLSGLFYSQFLNKHFIEHTSLEFFWTLIPVVILSGLGVLSMSTLFSREAGMSPTLSLKVTGHQWYWSYDYMDIPELSFDRYIVQLSDLNLGHPRNLSVDNNPVLPNNVCTRILVTRADVIHSWSVPALTIKVDAIPGKLNRVLVTPTVPGLYVGICREICGTGHRFIPIVVEVTRPALFKYWVIFSTLSSLSGGVISHVSFTKIRLSLIV